MAYTPMARISLPVSFLLRATMQNSFREISSPLLFRDCTSRTTFQFFHKSEKPCFVRVQPSEKNCPIWFFWFSRNSPAANASCGGCTCARLGGGLNARLLAEGRRRHIVRARFCPNLPPDAARRTRVVSRAHAAPARTRCGASFDVVWDLSTSTPYARLRIGGAGDGAVCALPRGLSAGGRARSATASA